MTKLTQQNGLDKESIRLAIQEYCQSRGISQNELATQASISSATVSKMLKGNWNDIRDSLWRKVWIVVSDGVDIFFKTSDHEAVKRLCKKACIQKLMAGLTGDTGLGKTTSLKAISRRPNTYYVSFDKTMRAKQFFGSILREMGIALLIIDESGKITHNVILYLHVLRDKTSKNAGIVLAGMPYFKNNLIKFSNKQKEGYAEFYRRINLWHEMEGLTKQEAQYICEQNGVTDNETLKELARKKRFGDLVNEIILYKEAQ